MVSKGAYLAFSAEVLQSMIGYVPSWTRSEYYDAHGHENPITSEFLKNHKGPFPGAPDIPHANDGIARADASVTSRVLKSFFKSKDTPYFSPEEVANLLDAAHVTAYHHQPVS